MQNRTESTQNKALSYTIILLHLITALKSSSNLTLTLSCSANERTEMKLKIYLSEAWMCSEFGYQRPMSNKKGLIIMDK